MDPNQLFALLGGTIGLTVLSLVCGGLLTVLITGGVIAAIVLTFRGMSRRRAEISQRAAAAAPATATIVNAESFSSENSSRLYVHLTLDVQPQFGSPYRTETHWAVDYIAASRLAPGQTVEVRVDPAQPGIVYPGVTWAEYTDSRVYRLR
jgi:hypothetical protein